MNKKQEKLLREFVRKNFVPLILKEKKRDQLLREHMREKYIFPMLKQLEEENKVRTWVRSLIGEVQGNITLENSFLKLKILQIHTQILVSINCVMPYVKQNHLSKQNINNLQQLLIKERRLETISYQRWLGYLMNLTP